MHEVKCVCNVSRILEFRFFKKKQTLVNQFISFFLLLFSLPHLGLQDRNKINDPSGLPWTLSLCPQECVDLLFFLKLSGELQYPSLIVLTVCFEGVSFLFKLNPRFLQLF